MCERNETFRFVSIIITILLMIVIIVGGVTISRRDKIDNFQVTVKDLSDEQKCIHICGFQYPGINYFDQYKFCVEKCDRISERAMDCE